MIDSDGNNTLVERKSNQFPFNPSDRLNVLLAAYNIGPKAVTYLLLPRDGYISTTNLHSSFKDTFRGSELGDIDPDPIVRSYTGTLLTAGLVTKAYFLPYFGTEKFMGFGQSEDAIPHAPLAAALVLDDEMKNQRSLYPILGQTSNTSAGGKRTSLRRVEILSYLWERWKKATNNGLVEVENEDLAVTEDEISKKLVILPSNVRELMTNLSVAKMVNYEGVTPVSGKVQVSFERREESNDFDITGCRFPTLTRQIAACTDVLSLRNLAITQKNIYNELPEHQKNAWDEDALRVEISRALTFLVAKDFLKRVNKYKGGEVQSSGYILEGGIRLTEGFISTLVSLVNNDSETIRRLQLEMGGIFSQLDSYARNSGDLYFPFSHSAARAQFKDNLQKVQDLIDANPETTFTIQQIAEILNMKEKRIRKYTDKLRERREVEVIKRGHLLLFKKLPQQQK